MCDAKNSPEPAFVSLPPLMFALANQLQVCCPNHVISSGFILSSFFNVLIFHFNILKSKLPHYVKFQGKIHRIPAPIHQNLTKVRPNDPPRSQKSKTISGKGHQYCRNRAIFSQCQVSLQRHQNSTGRREESDPRPTLAGPDQSVICHAYHQNIRLLIFSLTYFKIKYTNSCHFSFLL